MRLLTAVLASLSLVVAATAAADPTKVRDDVRAVAPALEKYREGVVLGDVWKRPGLGVRDRSIVTLAALVARNQTAEMPYYLALALDNGVKPAEISEIITHLAFYSGWGNAMSAVAVAKDIFGQRKIGADQLPTATPAPLPLNEARRQIGPNASAICSAPSFPASPSIQRMFCSATFGFAPGLRHETAAWSRSARSLPLAKSRNSLVT